jgi:hypothetical protein
MKQVSVLFSVNQKKINYNQCYRHSQLTSVGNKEGMESNIAPIKLHIPSPTQHQLSFCQATVEGMTNWTNNLPMANTGEAARQLYQAIRELNKLHAEPLLRFKLLEVMRPYIYSIGTLLAKHFLQTSVSLNERQLKIANLSQSLQTHLATGYKLVVANSIATLSSKDKISKIVTISIHRAITDTTNTILRAFQLYCHPPERSWSEINQLFLLAEIRGLEKQNVSDTQNRYLSTSNISAAFIRAHLLGTAKPSNLRQQDLLQLYDATELWADRVTITDGDDESALFIINLHRDSVAHYRQHLRDEQKPLFRSLNTAALVQELKSYAANPQGASSVTVPGKMSDNLLTHSIQAWAIHWQRSFRRMSTEGKLRLCIGLSATHYYIADKKDFKTLLNELHPKEMDKPHQHAIDIGSRSNNDVWSSAFDVGGSVIPENSKMNIDTIDFINKHKGEEEAPDTSIKYPAHEVTLINTSPGGYCLHWVDELPASIQAGEILGIQETGVQHWAIGVICWIRHLGKSGTQLGIELLAPKAESGAAKLLQKTGQNGDYVRSLLLPSIKAIAQPATLILPRMPFRTGNKVDILHHDSKGRQQLTKRITSTNSFSQFQFRNAGIKPNPQTLLQDIDLKDNDFDSLWKNL